MLQFHSTSVVLEATQRFSVLSLPLGLHDYYDELTSAVEMDFGDDIPLDDTSLQVLLESLNLAPASVTVKVPAINPVKLPFPLLCFDDNEGGGGETHSCSLNIEQDTEVSKMGQGGTGGIIWESSKACTQFIVHHYGLMESSDDRSGVNNNVGIKKLPKLVIELGSGTGLLGIATATLFHDRRQYFKQSIISNDDDDIYGLLTKFILTDQRNVVPLLQRNLVRNSRHGTRYNMEDMTTIAVDWNAASDREKLFSEIHQTVESLSHSSSDQGQEEEEEVLILCSDLVFGNNYENLITLMRDLQMLFIRLNESETRTKKKKNFHCHLLFCFEEREDRFPSPGFHQRLAEVFRIVKPTLLPHEFLISYPRIEISWLCLPN
jgi:hypothetical protein